MKAALLLIHSHHALYDAFAGDDYGKRDGTKSSRGVHPPLSPSRDVRPVRSLTLLHVGEQRGLVDTDSETLRSSAKLRSSMKIRRRMSRDSWRTSGWLQRRLRWKRYVYLTLGDRKPVVFSLAGCLRIFVFVMMVRDIRR